MSGHGDSILAFGSRRTARPGHCRAAVYGGRRRIRWSSHDASEGGVGCPVDRRPGRPEFTAPVAVSASSVSPAGFVRPRSRQSVEVAQPPEFVGVRPDHVMAVVVPPHVQPPRPQPTPDRVPADPQTPGQAPSAGTRRGPARSDSRAADAGPAPGAAVSRRTISPVNRFVRFGGRNPSAFSRLGDRGRVESRRLHNSRSRATNRG